MGNRIRRRSKRMRKLGREVSRLGMSALSLILIMNAFVLMLTKNKRI